MLDSRINTLAAQLSKMSPPQRQQFAKLHKDDPIAVGMAKYVNDQENAVRNAFALKDAPAAFMKPPVVDQTIAQMSGPKVAQPMPGGGAQTPEAGIGALAAPNLASMPDGGIAGDDPNAGKNPSPMGYAKGGVAHFAAGGYDAMGNPTGSDDPDYSDDSTIQSAQKWLQSPLGVPLGLPTQPQMARALTATAGGPGDKPYGKDEGKLRMRTDPNAQPTAPVAGIGAPEKEPKETPAMDALMEAIKGSGGGGGAPAGIGAPGGVPMQRPGHIDLQAEYDKRMADAQARPDPFTNERNKLAEARSAAAQGRVDDVKAEQDARGIAGLGREKRLKEREGKLDKEENDNKGMALLSAGLAMMAGTSPNAFANIGNGAQVGLKQYQEGKARLDAARDKIDDAYWQLEELRRNEGRMDAKDMREAKQGVRESVVQNMEEGYKAAQTMFGINRDTAVKMMDGAIKQNTAELGAWSHLQGADIQGRYSLAGHQIQAGATMGSAKLNALGHAATVEARNGEVKQLALGLNGERYADSAIQAQNKLRAGKIPAEPPLSPQEEEAIRARYRGAAGGAQSGIGVPQDTAPAFDMSKYKVLR